MPVAVVVSTRASLEARTFHVGQFITLTAGKASPPNVAFASTIAKDTIVALTMHFTVAL